MEDSKLMRYTHCTDCNKEKTTPGTQKRELCRSCANRIPKPAISVANKGKVSPNKNNKCPRTDEYRIKQSIAQGGTGILGKKRLRIHGLGEWADAVKARDGACIDCGSTERLEAHHLVLKSKFPEVATELWNGITLCRKCHIAEHKIIGKK